MLLAATAARAAQFVFVDQALTWTKGNNQQPAQLGPTNWESPTNYVDGRVYMRYEAIDKPSTKAIALQVCMWQDGYYLENCSPCAVTITTEGVYYGDMGTPRDWWKNGGRSLDWTRAFQQVTVVHKDGSCTGQLMQTEACGEACYNGGDIDLHVPITFDVDIVVVSSGGELDPPAGWSGCPWPPCMSAPAISLMPANLSFLALEGSGNPAAKAMGVTNGGIGTLDRVSTSIAYQDGLGWLTTTDPTTGGNSQSIINSVDITGLSDGAYYATVTVSAANAVPRSATYQVLLTVRDNTSAAALPVGVVGVGGHHGGTAKVRLVSIRGELVGTYVDHRTNLPPGVYMVAGEGAARARIVVEE
jgi:hypothetical protein